MNDLKATRTKAVLLQLAMLGSGTAFGQAAAGPFHFMVPTAAGPVSIGLKGAELGYEKRGPDAQILERQYAILHALLDWTGHEAERAHDQTILSKQGISVVPLARADRPFLESSLQEIRTRRNSGVTTNTNLHPISLQQMAEQHRTLIEKYKAQIAYGAPGQAAAPVAAKRETLLRALHDRIGALAAVGPTDEPGWQAALYSANATVAQFGRGDAVAPGARRADAMNALLGVYDRERTTAAAAASAAGRALDLEDATALRNRYTAFFDGAAGPRPNVAVPPAPVRDGRADLTVNPPQPPAKTAVPAPDKGGPGDSGGPGLFGILGGLLGGLLKTVVRAAAAVVNGAVGVAKALFS